MVDWFGSRDNYFFSRSFVFSTISNVNLINRIRSENRDLSNYKRDYRINDCVHPYSTHPGRRNPLHLQDFWHGRDRTFWKRSLEQNQSPTETHTCLAPLATYILQAEPEETSHGSFLWSIESGMTNCVMHYAPRWTQFHESWSVNCLKLHVILMPIKLLHAFTYIFDYRILILICNFCCMSTIYKLNKR